MTFSLLMALTGWYFRAMFADVLTVLAVTATATGIYRLGYGAAERHWRGIVDQIQYPAGCTCIRNALAANPSCPHHQRGTL